MDIEFERDHGELVLIYRPDMMDPRTILQRLSDGEVWHAKNCFAFTKELLRQSEDNFDADALRFCIGIVGPDYTEMDSDVIGTKHIFYFANDISLSEKCS